MSVRGVQSHALAVRIGHWLMAVAILVMIGSGWRIYNASPIFPFRFPVWATLGGDVEAALARHGDPGVATAIAWHLAGMWLLFLSFLVLDPVGRVLRAFPQRISCRSARAACGATRPTRCASGWSTGSANTTPCRRRSTGAR